LSAALQTKLKDIATILSRASEFPANGGGYEPTPSGQSRRGDRRPSPRRGSYHYEKTLQDLREQGERLIDSVRHDDYYTMHKTLRDLQSRINSNYEFTVFAADKNHQSVNFGLLNTYRQEMAPINYQAGQLIKTIPLSPKEERKYSMKT